MRALDEVAWAIYSLRGGVLPFLSAFGLEEIFGRPLKPRDWKAIQRALGCPLPPLVCVQGHWFLPDGLETIWDLADYASRGRPDWKLPTDRTGAAWRNAQIFAGVRRTLADAGSLDENDIFRESRLKADLGLE